MRPLGFVLFGTWVTEVQSTIVGLRILHNFVLLSTLKRLITDYNTKGRNTDHLYVILERRKCVIAAIFQMSDRVENACHIPTRGFKKDFSWNHDFLPKESRFLAKKYFTKFAFLSRPKLDTTRPFFAVSC